MNEILSQSYTFRHCHYTRSLRDGLYKQKTGKAIAKSLTDLRNPDRGSIVIVPYRLSNFIRTAPQL